MKPRVVITGYGAVTSLGADVESTWSAMQAGDSGIDVIKQWDVTEWRFRLGGEIKDFDRCRKTVDKKILKLISRHDVVGLSAASHAMTHSDLLTYRDNLTDPTIFNERSGIYVGSPGNKYNQQYDFLSLIAKAQKDMQVFAKELFSEVHPMWLLKILPNNVLAYAAIQYGFKGANQNITNHGISGLQAIIEAYHAIQSGQIDRALVVAYDTAYEPQSVVYYGESGLLSDRAIKPFDRNRDGTILAEGAGALLLESKEAAQQRNAKIYGEILAGGVSSDAAGIFNLDSEAASLTHLMQHILTRAEVAASDVGMISTHGNGTTASDATEAQAINTIFNGIPATSFKWAIGHTIAAAGVIETILALTALQQKIIPGIATLEHLADDCAELKVSKSAQIPRSTLGLVVSRGFGGMNAGLLIKTEHSNNS